MAEADLEFLRRKLNVAQASEQQTAPVVPPLAPGGKPPDMGSMNERLAKLEGAFDWMKVAVALIGTVLIGGIAFLGVQITRVDGRVSALSDKVDGRIAALSDKVDALPDRMNANLRDLTNTLSQAILASKQAAPQVILLPAPQSPPTAPP